MRFQFIRPFYAPNPGQGLPDLKNIQDLNDELARMRDTLTSVGDSFRTQLTRQIAALPQSAQAAANDFKRDFTGALSSINTNLRQTEKEINARNKNLRTVESVERQLNSVIDAKNELQRSQLNLQKQGVRFSSQQVREFADANQEADDLIKYLQKQLEIQTKNKKQMEGFKNLITEIGRIPILGSLVGAPKIIRAMEEAASRGAGKMKQFGVGLDQLFKNIGKGLIAGAFVSGITFIIKAVTDFDKKSFEIAKNLGVTASKAKDLQASFQAIAISSGNIALTSSQVARTYEEFSNTAGFLVPTNQAFLETATLLQKQLGLSGEHLNVIATQSALSGKSFSDTFRTLEGIRVVEGARNKLSLSTKQILDAISKVSSNVLVNFKGSDKALEAAVIRAAKLGTSLEQVNKQASGLVDFENSIQAEFEAQVLTGRNLNLTRARELALLGKTAELMEELNKQNVTLKQYQDMTLIEKEAFAKAINLTSEELSKQLIDRERANKLGAEQGVSLQQQYKTLLESGKSREYIIGLIGKEQEADLNKAAMADKFNATMERLKDTLGSILEGPMRGIIEKFTNFVNDGEKMKRLGEAIKGVFEKIQSVVKSLPQYLSQAIFVAKALATVSIVRAVSSVVAGLTTVGPLGAIAGIYAGYQVYNWLDGLLSGAGGGAPTVSTPAAPTTSITPMNPATESARQTAAGTAAAEEKPPVFNFNVTAQIGNENLSRLTRASIQQDPGTVMA